MAIPFRRDRHFLALTVPTYYWAVQQKTINGSTNIMLYSKKTEYLMESIRAGRSMHRGEKLNLIVGLSIPSMLAQISTVMMFFIDASMVGHLGAEASASIGLIESTTWLIGSLLSAFATGFSVQVAHFIGANDFGKARLVFRHSLLCGIIFSILIALIGVGIHSPLPHWLGGGDDIADKSSAYFLVYSLVLPFVYLYHMSGMMLKAAGNMHTPSHHCHHAHSQPHRHIGKFTAQVDAPCTMGLTDECGGGIACPTFGRQPVTTRFSTCVRTRYASAGCANTCAMPSR